MISDQIKEILKQREYQVCSRESEPKLIRLEPRQIRSVSIVEDNNEDLVYVKIKNRLFKGPEIIITDDEDSTRNLIDYEIRSPWWARNNEFLYWIRIKNRKRICVRVTISTTFEYLDVKQQAYIRVYHKSGDDLLIFPKDRGEFVYVRDKINEMVNTDKPIWIKI
jgi:hypothetical protein